MSDMTTTPQVTTNATPFQLFPTLEPATEAALRESIQRFGVLVPVAKDQHGNTLDGHQRSRIALELGVDYRVDIHVCADDEEARDIAHTLNADRRQMNAEQRRQVVAALREQGHSLRAIAGAVGVDPMTVHNDLSGVEISTPDSVLGKDGKRYKAKRTVVVAKTQREAGRAQEALTAIDDIPSGVIDLKRSEKIAREHQASRARLKPVPLIESDQINIAHADLADWMSAVDISGAVVISDPPYPREFLPAWETLAQRGLEAGVDQMVLMCGQTTMADVIAIFANAAYKATPDAAWERWHLRWCCAYLTYGPATRVWHHNVGTRWKPLLVFDRNEDRPFLTMDVFTSDGDDKRHHYWGQNEQGFARIVEAFTNPGDLVVDPFLGGGTTAIVCRDLGRRFAGCDIDAAAVNTTIQRLAT